MTKLALFVIATSLVACGGKKKSGGSDKDSLLSDTFEAIVAAIFLDGGSEAAFAFVRRGFADDLASLVAYDPKTELQHLTQKLHGTLPVYAITDEVGPEHARTFHCEVSVQASVVGRGDGKSKKAAEQAAARAALLTLTRANPAKDNR